MDYNFYSQFVKGLYLTDKNKILYLYYLYHGELSRVVRVYWALNTPDEREKNSVQLVKFFTNKLYRPGDA
tara:strand:+ start:933 stop:1142 length:210 start_codon:yes stop_codon:yes gene_type:complete